MDTSRFVKIVVIWAVILLGIKLLFFTNLDKFQSPFANNLAWELFNGHDIYSLAKLGILIVAAVALFKVYMENRK